MLCIIHVRGEVERDPDITEAFSLTVSVFEYITIANLSFAIRSFSADDDGSGVYHTRQSEQMDQIDSG